MEPSHSESHEDNNSLPTTDQDDSASPTPWPELTLGDEDADAPEVLDPTCSEYVGRWNHLISSTNWEKGKIIHLWRTVMIESGADQSDYADEVWSKAVGMVTPQHVGRLRRVYERFDAMREKFPKLYWSHYQAALDWNDAEMWLEGAVQSSWSVARMRQQRWEAQGAPESLKPQPGDIISTELDEDSWPEDREAGGTEFGAGGADPGNLDDVASEYHDTGEDADMSHYGDAPFATEVGERPEPVRPFADLQEVPEDLQQAFEQVRVAILRHKMGAWREVSAETVLSHLAALSQLVTAPSDV